MVGYSFLDDSFIRNPMPVYPGANQPCRPLRVPHEPNRSWFPSPATSNGACRFPALRSPARLARRFMRRSQLEVLSSRISHQQLLHAIQPLPSSPSCISSVSGLADYRAFLSDAPASHHCQRNYETAGFLRSLGITPVHRYFEPFRHLLAFLPFPGSAGYRSDLLQSISLWDEEGFSRCVTCPCRRAAPTTPPECHVASVSPRHAMLPSFVGRRLGFRF